MMVDRESNYLKVIWEGKGLRLLTLVLVVVVLVLIALPWVKD